MMADYGVGALGGVVLIDPTTGLPYKAVGGGGGGGAVDSVNGKTGVVVLSASDVGLGNVDNTSDANKPVSTAQAAALATKAGGGGALMGVTVWDDVGDITSPVTGGIYFVKRA